MMLRTFSSYVLVYTPNIVLKKQNNGFKGVGVIHTSSGVREHVKIIYTREITDEPNDISKQIG